MKLGISLILFYFFLPLELQAEQFSLKTTHYQRDGLKIAKSEGHFISPLSPLDSYEILKDPTLYKEFSRYVVRANRLSDDVVAFKLCFLFVCRKPKLKFFWVKNSEVKWKIQNGRYKGSFGSYEIEKTSPTKVRFMSEINYSESLLPEWLIRYAVKETGKVILSETIKHLEKQKKPEWVEAK